MKIKVENLQSNKGNKVPNQFIIRFPKGVLFQSYDAKVALKTIDGKILLDEKYWDYSNTTRKYRNIFLNESSKTIKEKIDSGEYILTNLEELE